MYPLNQNLKKLNFYYQAEDVESVVESLEILHKENPSLVDDEMVKFLISRAHNSTWLADALKALYKINPSLVNDENRAFLDKHAKYVEAIYIIQNRSTAVE